MDKQVPKESQVRSSYGNKHTNTLPESDSLESKHSPADSVAVTVSVFVSAVGVEKSPETGLWEIKLPARPLLRAERQMLNTLFPNTMVQVQDLLNKEALLYAIANQ